MSEEPLRLGVNIDHVATLRNARGGGRPDPLRAALQAIAAGADYLVVGRPIVEAADPKAAAEAIHGEIGQSLV